MKQFVLRAELTLPLGLFLLSALVGVWAAYNPTFALYRFALLVIAVALYYVLVALYLIRTRPTSETSFPPPLAVTLTWLGFGATALLVLLFSIQKQLFEPHSIAAVLEIMLPIACALMAHLVQDKAWRRLAAALALTVILGLGLALTDSKSTWLTTSVVCLLVLVWFLRLSRKRRAARVARHVWVVVGLGILGISIVVFLQWSFVAPVLERIVGTFFDTNADFSRVELYQIVWNLIRDYPFTGSGLGTFPMLLSTYGLLIHVYFLPHAHNVFLQVWLEQGILGVLALVLLVLAFYAWVWKKRRDLNWLAVGAIGATTACFLHGLWDAQLYYSDWTLTLFFLPMGLAFAASRPLARDGFTSWHESRVRQGLLVSVLIFGILIALLDVRAIEASWFANLGSVAETRVELGPYEYPRRMVESIRHEADYTTAYPLFQAALSLDPGNVTANQRLGTIALSRGDYAAAYKYLETALTREPNNPVTWQLLGDAYLALGRLDDAYSFWSRVRNAPVKLELEALFRYKNYGDVERANWTRELAVRILGHSLDAK